MVMYTNVCFSLIVALVKISAHRQYSQSKADLQNVLPCRTAQSILSRTSASSKIIDLLFLE